MAIPKLNPELMFKQLERIESKMKSAKSAEEVKALYERQVAIEAFIDNCALATLEDAAADLRIDTRLFDLPLLSSFLQLPEGTKVPAQLAMDFNQPIETTTTIEVNDETAENPVVDLEEVDVQQTLKLDYEHPEILRIMNALYTGLSDKEDIPKYLRAAANVVRKKLNVPEEVDSFTIIDALIKPKGFSAFPKFKEFAKKFFELSMKDSHAINCMIEAKRVLPEWDDDSLARLVGYLITSASPSMVHHNILDCDRKIITALTKNAEFISKLAEAWPNVNYSRQDKKTGTLIEEILPCTEPKAAAYHVAKLYNLVSPTKRAKLAHRKIYVEKGYPAQ